MKRSAPCKTAPKSSEIAGLLVCILTPVSLTAHTNPAKPHDDTYVTRFRAGAVVASDSSEHWTVTDFPRSSDNASLICSSDAPTGEISERAESESQEKSLPSPPAPGPGMLSDCAFKNPMRPWRIDNECKAVLDEVAMRLHDEPESKLVIVGNAEPTEKHPNLAAERAVNSKAYLTGGEAKQAIDPNRIECRTGSGGTTTVEFWDLPPGATFSLEGTKKVDEHIIKPVRH